MHGEEPVAKDRETVQKLLSAAHLHKQRIHIARLGIKKALGYDPSKISVVSIQSVALFHGQYATLPFGTTLKRTITLPRYDTGACAQLWRGHRGGLGAGSRVEGLRYFHN